MKTPIPFALAVSAALACAAAAASLEDAEKRAQVTLPFSEVKSLLEAAKPPARPEEPPPVASAITSADVAISFDPAKPTATAAFEIEIFARGWQVVPLIGATAALQSASTQKANVVMRDGVLCLLAKEPGHFSVSLVFDIAAKLAEPGAGGIELKLPPATVGRLAATDVPARHHAVSNDGRLQFPVNGGTVRIALVEDKKDNPAAPTVWTTTAQTFIRQCEDRLQCESRIRLNGGSGNGLSAALELPPAAMQVEISGADLRSHDTLSLAWETSGVLARDIDVRYDLPLPAAGEAWNIQPPRVAGAKQAASRTVLVPLPGIALSGQPVRAIDDPASLPSWMSSLAAAGAWESDSAAPFTVESRALPRLEADTARISKSEYQTRLVADGAQLTDAHIVLQHRGPLRWRFSLPKGSALLSCEVNGAATNPLVLDDGLLEIFIGGDGRDRAAQAEITFSYTARGSAFAPVEGRVALTLAATPLFIDELDWTLTLPDGYESSAFEGNVEPSGKGSQIAFRKRLVRNEAAAVEVFYSKRAIN